MEGENEKKLQHHFGNWKAKPEKRKIISANHGDWYKNMIGKVIEIKVYGTFGCVDMQDRWVSFYDLSEVIQ